MKANKRQAKLEATHGRGTSSSIFSAVFLIHGHLYPRAAAIADGQPAAWACAGLAAHFSQRGKTGWARALPDPLPLERPHRLHSQNRPLVHPGGFRALAR